MTYIRKADKNLIKKINMASIMDVIRSESQISRADIAKILGLNSATVSNNVADLIRMGYLREIGAGISSGGRKPILLMLETNKIFMIGIYVGIKRIEIGIMNLHGAIIDKEIISIFNYEEIIGDITEAVKLLLQRNEINAKMVEGIGVGYHGIVDSDKGISLYAPAFKTHNIDIRTELETVHGIPVAIDNDARVMAMGEKYFGFAKEFSDFVFINMDQGIGSGIFIDNKLYHGMNFGAGEIGHVKLTNEAITCRCGRSGCFEAICSVAGLENRYYSKTGKDVTFDEFINLLDSGDPVCKSLKEDTIRITSEAFEMIINFLNPQAIIMTGRVSKLLPECDEILNEVRYGTMDANAKNMAIYKSEVEDLRIVGSACLVYNKIFKIN